MSVSYKAVGWNAFKKRYDLLLVIGIVLFLGVFIGVGLTTHPAVTLEILLMRATAVAAFTLLHVILAIGPLARLNKLWLPVVYNRRHLGVAMFMLAFIHAMLGFITYHVGGPINPVLSIFTADAGVTMSTFPFQAFGFAALMILFVMAATSHDFWLANLSAPVWKTLHMLVYLAYLLLIVHVAFGVLQSETSPIYAMLTGLGVVVIGGLHLRAGWSQMGIEAESARSVDDKTYVEVCQVSDLTENIPLGASVNGERVAVILYEGNKVSTVSGVCQHQNGPLAEGQFKYGCLTCPWHGFQYKPHDGTSPAPFTEKIPTFDIKIVDGKVLVKSKPNAAGTPVEPAICRHS
ncbi:MAG: ferric reductase-like transmembrane domain-containing protein [Verrucomicrobia bacterium]|nr:ferric reductase-like transmembrane domain-containing protein [Verrucomicrobiota bacterium]